jgi:hypothetical protein
VYPSIQYNLLESKLSEISKMQVFQKREKLVHSPEANREGSQEDRYFSNRNETYKNSTKNEIETLLQQTEYQVYQYDRVLSSNKNDSDIVKEFIDPVKDDLLKRNRTLMIINLCKSNTILNYACDEATFINEMMIAESNQGPDRTNLGLLPNLLIKASKELSDTSLDQLAKIDLSYNEINLSAFSISGNKFYDLTSIELRGYDNHKELSKIRLNSFKDISHYMQNIRNNLVSKKLSLHWICYRVKLKTANIKSREYSQIIFFDFLSPFEKIPEKLDKDYKKDDLSLDNFVSGMKILYHLFTNTKSDQPHLIHKDKMFSLFSKYWNYNAKIHLIGNIKPISPYYHQNMPILHFLSNIRKRREAFDSLFVELLYQVNREIYSFNYFSNLEI